MLVFSFQLPGGIKERVFRSVIPRNVRLGEAPSFGKPAMLYDISCKGAQAYLALAKEIVEHEEARPGKRT